MSGYTNSILDRLDARPCYQRGWHDTDGPVCKCGHRWTAKSTYSDGQVVYTDAKFRDRYIALYGEPPTGILEVLP